MSKFTTRDQKEAAVERVDALRNVGKTAATAARAVGCSVQQYQRWKRGEGLGKRGVSDEKRTGRPPALELDAEEENRLRYWALRKESTPLAVERFVREGKGRPETLDALGNLLDRAANRRSRVSWPLAVQRACKVSEEEKALFRGQKHAADVVPVGFRLLQWIDEAGHTHDLRPGDFYESDDMSGNQPFRYCDLGGSGADGEETLGRQILLSNCIQSLRFLGATPIGRPKDAYRAEDIADHMLSIVEAWGLPLFWRLERGPWENDFVNGCSLKELGPRFEDKRWGALDDLFTVIRAYGSRGKGAIEGSFHFLQALLAHENDTVEIGRSRGEFEEATKAFLRARQIKDPVKRQRELDKFWSIDEAANGLLAGMEDFNRRPKQRREWGQMMQVPEELWAEHPGKRELDPEDRWYFYPVKKLVTVRHGQIITTLPHYGQKIYTVNGVPDAMADFLPHGQRVLLACDPARPELGARICNAETGALNRGDWSFGELLVPNAPDWSLEAPVQVDLRIDREVKRTLGRSKKAAAAAARTEFRATREAGKEGADPIRKSVARDGLGRSVTLRNTPAIDPPEARERRATRPASSASRNTSPTAADLAALEREEEEVLGNL